MAKIVVAWIDNYIRDLSGQECNLPGFQRVIENILQFDVRPALYNRKAESRRFIMYFRLTGGARHVLLEWADRFRNPVDSLEISRESVCSNLQDVVKPALEQMLGALFQDTTATLINRPVRAHAVDQIREATVIANLEQDADLMRLVGTAKRTIAQALTGAYNLPGAAPSEFSFAYRCPAGDEIPFVSKILATLGACGDVVLREDDPGSMPTYSAVYDTRPRRHAVYVCFTGFQNRIRIGGLMDGDAEDFNPALILGPATSVDGLKARLDALRDPPCWPRR